MEMGMTSLGNLAKLGQGVRSRRWSSYDKTGGNGDSWPMPAGKTVVLGKMEGAGCIRHIWFTTKDANNDLRRLVLRIYWDDEETPSVQCPVGDFFGLGHGKANYFQSMPLQVSWLGMNCWFPMPYAKGAKITITNDSENDSFLYFYIDYHQYDKPMEGVGKFHANWRREIVVKKPDRTNLNTTGDDNYLVLDAEGKGHYVGCCLHIDTNEPGWWGEGDDMFFVDGETWPPNMHGTGTEDYFCGSYNFENRETHQYQVFSTPYTGLHQVIRPDGVYQSQQRFGLYRWHITDPIRFERDLRVTIQALGWRSGGRYLPLQDDIASVAYWYQSLPTAPFPQLPAKDMLEVI